MAPTRRPSQLGLNSDTSGVRNRQVHKPGPVGHELRFPTLELFAAEHGDAFSGQGFPLTLHQLKLAKPIFGSSLRYADIRIVIAPFINSPTTLGRFVRVAPHGGINDGVIPDRTLIHELTHVWQFQTRGMRYMSNSLCQQMAATIVDGSRNAAYVLTRTEVVEAGLIDRLSAEKQATLVEYWFADDNFDDEPDNPGGPSQPVRGEPVCDSMLEEIRSARPLPRNYILEEAAWGSGMSSRRILDSGRPEASEVPWLRFEF